MPDDVEAVLALGMAKDPDERLQTIDELVTALATAHDRKLSGALGRRATALLARHPWRDGRRATIRG